MKKAIQFGAGKIGRGFLGELFSQSGYEVVFVDIDEEVISHLNQKRVYRIKTVGDNPKVIEVRNVRGVSAQNVERVSYEIANAQIAATAVGARALKAIAPLIARGLERRAARKIKEPLNIIICENLLYSSQILKEYIWEQLSTEGKVYAEAHLGLIESVVSRMVPIVSERIGNEDPLLIITEEYDVLPVDKGGFIGRIPKIKGLIPYDNLSAYTERKLFTHNTGHALCSYWGYLRGYTYIFEAVQDDRVRNMVLGALQESGQALIQKHGFTAQGHQKYIKDLLRRFNNIALKDSVARGAKDPIRKLGPQERLVGAANLAREFGIEPDYLARGIAAALCYDNPKDKEAIELSQRLKDQGVDTVLKDICNLEPEGKLALLIKEKLKEVPMLKGR